MTRLEQLKYELGYLSKCVFRCYLQRLCNCPIPSFPLGWSHLLPLSFFHPCAVWLCPWPCEVLRTASTLGPVLGVTLYGLDVQAVVTGFSVQLWDHRRQRMSSMGKTCLTGLLTSAWSGGDPKGPWTSRCLAGRPHRPRGDRMVRNLIVAGLR